MDNPNRSRAIAGLSFNIILAIVIILITWSYHEKWDGVKTPADKRLVTDEKVLRLFNYELLPAVAGGMILSAFWFWKLRK
jgi:hypothetical protein